MVNDAKSINDFFKELDELEAHLIHGSYNYADLELRVAAAKAEDEAVNGEDIHKKMACAMFGLTHCDVREKHRNAAKSENFRQLYSLSAKDDVLVYPSEPTHCRKCLKPLTTSNPQTYNVCARCEDF